MFNMYNTQSIFKVKNRTSLRQFCFCMCVLVLEVTEKDTTQPSLSLIGTFSTDGFQNGYGNRGNEVKLICARECHPRSLAAVAAFPSTANRVV